MSLVAASPKSILQKKPFSEPSPRSRGASSSCCSYLNNTASNVLQPKLFEIAFGSDDSRSQLMDQNQSNFFPLSDVSIGPCVKFDLSLDSSRNNQSHWFGTANSHGSAYSVELVPASPMIYSVDETDSTSVERAPTPCVGSVAETAPMPCVGSVESSAIPPRVSMD